MRSSSASVPGSPVRTCVGCGARSAKSDLLRVVAVGGAIVADPAARRPGRGAYLHLSLDCWERARRRRALPRALRAAGPLADEGLVSYLRAVAGTVDQPVDEAGTGGQYGGDDEDKDERSMSKRR